MPLILVADDDDILVDLVSFRLESAGYQVIVAADGRQTLELARSAQPDAIVLDAMMPILTGIEVLRELRADPVLADIPVMVLSARKGEDDIVATLQAGAQDYLTKPFIPQELAVRVGMLLRSRPQSISRAL